MRTREELLDRVRSRVERATRGDPDAVSADAALREADELLMATRNVEQDFDVLGAIGHLYWTRHLATEATRDAMTALMFLHPVYRHDAMSVPADVRAFFATPGRSLLDFPLWAYIGARVLQHAAEQPGLDDSVLDEAVRLLRLAADAAPDDYDQRPALLHNLATAEMRLARRKSNLARALGDRFVLHADRADLEEAERLARESLNDDPDDDPARGLILNNLAYVLGLRFDASGDGSPLEEAVGYGRGAVDALPGPGEARAAALSNLGLALQRRAGLLGDRDSLDEAVWRLREAVSQGPSFRSQIRTNLCGALVEHYEITRDPASLAAAITVGREAVSEGDDLCLPNLGNALLEEYRRTEAPACLEEAIACYEAVLDLGRRTGDRDLAGHLDNLANALALRAATGKRADLVRAVELHREALGRVEEGHPVRVTYLFNLAMTLLELRGDERAGREAIELLMSAAEIPDGSPVKRLIAARGAGQAAVTLRDAARANRAYRRAVELLPLIASRRLGRSDQYHWLAEFVGVAADAAAIATRTGDPETAVSLLELGRGVLMTRELDLRGDIEELSRRAPAEARRFRELRDELDVPIGPRSSAGLLKRHRAVVEEFEALIARVRTLPGLDGFLRAPSVRELRAAAGEGALVYVNFSPYGCDALLVTSAGVTPVALDIELPDILERFALFAVYVHMAQSRELEQSQRDEAELAIRSELVWLWETVTSRVLDTLGHRAIPGASSPWPRVWWIPVGGWSQLPLHAAGHHGDPDGPAVLNRVISSYTPTARALIHARRPRPSTPEEARLLVVAMPRTRGASDLPGAAQEARFLEETYAGDCRVVRERGATRNTVRDALRTCRWAHFACHGKTIAGDPGGNSLLLYDRPLTVAELTALRLEHAELAYFSACSAAQSELLLSDEAIHITSSAQLAGFGSVIGTLWPIYDDVAVDIAKRFYEELGREGSRSAAALHAATRAARREHADAPSAWSAFVHVGV